MKENSNFDTENEAYLDENISYEDFLVLLPLCGDETISSVLENLKQAPKPEYLGDKKVPEDLWQITYGQLDDLHDSSEADDPVVETIKIIMDMTEDEIYACDVDEVVGFANFVADEIKKINELFSSIKPMYSKEEKRAGIEKLSFGSFGVLDWYAKRMGIADQNEVRDVPWIRIYQCMKNDNDKNNFERKLNDVFRDNSRPKK